MPPPPQISKSINPYFMGYEVNGNVLTISDHIAGHSVDLYTILS